MVAKPWPPPTLREWLEAVNAESSVDWWLHRLIPADCKLLISGPAKTSRKTMAIMAMLRCLVTGKDMEGLKIGQSEPIKCCLLEYEGPEKPLAQFWQWMDAGAGWDCDLDNLLMAHRYHHIRITDGECIDRLCKMITENEIRGLVIDTFTKASAANENDARALTDALGHVDKMLTATNKGFVAYIHHLRKASDPWDEDIDVQVRGNTAFTGDYDHHLAFREGYANGSVHLYTRSKVDHDRYYRWMWDIDGENGRITFDILEFETENPPAGGLVSECTEAIVGNNVKTLRQLAELWDMPRTVTRWMVDAMVNAGILEPTAKGWRKVG